MDNKNGYLWNILNESNSFSTFPTDISLLPTSWVLFLKTASEVSSLREFRISSQIFGDNEARFSPLLYAVFLFFLHKIHAFLKF